MARKDRIRITDTEARRLSGASTKVYFRSVMRKLFPDQWEEHLQKLLSGDRPTLDFCAEQLTKNLDFFPLLHTLCLVTGRRFDLQQDKDRARAADAWICWYEENRDRLVWDKNLELWQVLAKKPMS